MPSNEASIPNEDADAERIEEWVSDLVGNPEAWLAEADRIKRAADVLAERFQAEAHGARVCAGVLEDVNTETTGFGLAPAYLMLAGYAIENLAKGLIVSADLLAMSRKQMTSTHLTAQLIRAAKFELINGEEDLVERLGHRIRWAGRYPAPRERDASALHARIRERGWLWGNLLRASTGDVGAIDLLFDRMRAQLVREIHSQSKV